MHKIYQEEKIPLNKRIKRILPRKLGGITIFILFIILASNYYLLYNKTLLIIGTVLIISGLMFLQNWIKIGTYYHEVDFDDNYIIFRGQKFNHSVNSKFNIKQVNIYLRPENSKNGLYNIYLEFEAGKNKFRFNQLRNWDYEHLYALFIDFKEAKGEKIILDENYLLEKLKN